MDKKEAFELLWNFIDTYGDSEHGTENYNPNFQTENLWRALEKLVEKND